MKFRNLLQLFGLRGKPKRYGYTLTEFSFPDFGKIYFAQWNHPCQKNVELSNDDVLVYRQYIHEGDFCIDIGAHSGDSTIPMALAAGRGGMVLALEPNPYVFPVLQKNCRLNKPLTNIVPILAAAAEHDGEMIFEYSDAGFCNGGRHEGISILRHGHPFKLSVFGINLENELRHDYSEVLPNLKMIKIDAEGYDLYIIKSLAGIISEFRPYIKTEIFKHTTADYRRDLLNYFDTINYTVYKIEREPCVIGQVIQNDNINQWRHYDVFCIPENITATKE